MSDLFRRRIVGASLALLWIAAAPNMATASDADLLVPVTPADTARAAAPQNFAGAPRQRLVALDRRALEGAAASPSGQAGRKLRIGLFPGVSATFDLGEPSPAYGGGSVRTGSAIGRDGEATLVLGRGGALTGQVTLDGRSYRISPRGGRLHEISEIGRLPPFGPSRISPAAAQAPAAPRRDAEAAPGQSEPTALFVYTERARNSDKDILSKINLAVSLTNQAYENSGVRMRLRLAGAMLLKDFEERDRSYDRILDDLTDGKAMADVRKRRDELGADFVVLIREGGEYCGLAWYNAPPTDAARYAYSEVTRGCIEGDVVAHEIGHNMGLSHDRYVESRAPKSEYNFGFVNARKRVYDIMAYDDECLDRGVDCRRVRRFSDPDDIVKNTPFGVPKGEAGASDGVRWLNMYRADIAALRDGPAKPDTAREAADAQEAADIAETFSAP